MERVRMGHKAISVSAVSVLIGFALYFGLGLGVDAQAQTPPKALPENDRQISAHAQRMMNEGRRIFRFDTFGS